MNERLEVLQLVKRYLQKEMILGTREIYLPRKAGIRDQGAGISRETVAVAGGSGRDKAGISEQLREKTDLLQGIAREVESCAKCPLHKTRTQSVFQDGDPKAEIVFIGEAPGREEDLQGKPFVGEAGKLLTRIIESIGFKREEVYITNILKSRPPNNRNPLASEITACLPFLKRQLEVIQPKIICALGTFASQTLLNTTIPISQLRGRVHDYEGIPLIPTFHPAALLRNPGWKKDAWEDMKLLKKVYEKLISKFETPNSK